MIGLRELSEPLYSPEFREVIKGWSTLEADAGRINADLYEAAEEAFLKYGGWEDKAGLEEALEWEIEILPSGSSGIGDSGFDVSDNANRLYELRQKRYKEVDLARVAITDWAVKVGLSPFETFGLHQMLREGPKRSLACTRRSIAKRVKSLKELDVFTRDNAGELYVKVGVHDYVGIFSDEGLDVSPDKVTIPSIPGSSYGLGHLFDVGTIIAQQPLNLASYEVDEPLRIKGASALLDANSSWRDDSWFVGGIAEGPLHLNKAERAENVAYYGGRIDAIRLVGREILSIKDNDYSSIAPSIGVPYGSSMAPQRVFLLRTA